MTYKKKQIVIDFIVEHIIIKTTTKMHHKKGFGIIKGKIHKQILIIFLLWKPTSRHVSPPFLDCMTEELSGVIRTRQCERTTRILRDLESALALGDDTWKFNELEYQIGHFYLQWSFSYSSEVAVARYALNWSTKVLFNHLPINTKLETIYTTRNYWLDQYW